jgi:hypothetical protein
MAISILPNPYTSRGLTAKRRAVLCNGNSPLCGSNKKGQHFPSELSRLSLELERQHSKWAILRRHGSPECRLRVLVAVVFFTSGGIPMRGDEKPALPNFVRSGCGFIGVHYFYAWASVL